ncbi:MAG: hypothetical protein AAF597_11630, partial [Bacteroidota bacterium]
MGLYEEVITTGDRVERVAAYFGVLKASQQLESPPALAELLQQLADVRHFVRALEEGERTELQKEWRISDRSLTAQEKVLRKRLERALKRSDLVGLRPLRKDLVAHPVWSKASYETLADLGDARELALLPAALDTASRKGLQGIRIWHEQHKKYLYTKEAQATVQSLKAQYVRSIVNNPNASYAELSEVHNHHYSSEAAMSPKFRSRINNRLLEIYITEYGVNDFHRFIAENPAHWFSRDCWADELATIFQTEDYGALTSFLVEHPYTVLDEFVVATIAPNPDFHRAQPNANDKVLDAIEEEWALRKLLLTDRDTSPATFQRFSSWLTEAVPAIRCHRFFKSVAQLYLEEQEWDQLNVLIALGKKLFVNGAPTDCFEDWMDYRDKQPWLKAVQQILAYEAAPPRSVAVPPASTAGVGEYSPVISADNQQLFFARYQGVGTTYDVMVTRRDEAGDWTTARKVGNLSSGKVNEVPLSITAAGDELLLFLDGRLAISRKTARGWSKPALLKGSIAELNWHGSATISPDGQYLILESYASMGDQTTFADTDLYLATRAPDGHYNVTTDLKTLNTRRRETSPYISPDGKT